MKTCMNCGGLIDNSCDFCDNDCEQEFYEPRKKSLDEARELLEELREYMFSRADADYQDEKYVGNQEMKFIQRIDEVLERIK